MQIKDQLNRNIQINATPKRIVSLVPSQTELLVDLGLQKQIVGVTKFCVHPKGITMQKQIVGGTKQININKIKKLNPDIILCNKEENTKAIVASCMQVCNTHVSDVNTIPDSLALINQYGAIFKKKPQALKISSKIQQELADFKLFVHENPVLKTVYFIWKNPWMVAANNTFINVLLALNNFDNAYKEKERYPEIELNALVPNKTVDLVLLATEPYPFKSSHKKSVQEYYPNAKIEIADGEMFSWYGSRLTKAFSYFKNLHLKL